MQSKIKKLGCLLLSLMMTVGVSACGGAGGNEGSSVGGGDSSSRREESSSETQQKEYLENGMPDYDSVTVEPLMFNSYIAPFASKTAFQEYMDCGFNWVNIYGRSEFNFPNLGGVETALGWCDELGLKALVNVTDNVEQMYNKGNGSDASPAERFSAYESFQGFYFDEPFMDYHGTKPGINQLEMIIGSLINESPNTSFCANLNPVWFIDKVLPANERTYTYEQYVDAMTAKINQQYEDAGSTAYRWISGDDYPFWIDKSNNSKWLANDWLRSLAHLAVEKQECGMENVVSNYFIQAMPFTNKSSNQTREREIGYNEMKMQAYTLMAFGYDSISFFCYGTPSVGVEFDIQHLALVDREGNKTSAWYDAQRVMTEINKFQNTYMQFNDYWWGIYPVNGTGSTREDFTALASTSNHGVPQSIISTSDRELLGLQSATATKDTIIGCMLDEDSNSGFVVVNYNDTVKNYNSTVQMQFDADMFSKAWVYIDGVKDEVQLTGGKLTLQLDVGEGVFVIPIKNQ